MDDLDITYRLIKLDDKKAGAIEFDGTTVKINKIDMIPPNGDNPPYIGCDYVIIDGNKPNDIDEFEKRLMKVIAHVVDEFLTEDNSDG